MAFVLADPSLYNFGKNAEELNRSVLIGQEVIVTREPTLDDYAAYGLERAIEHLNQETTVEHDGDNVVVTSPGKPLMYVNGTVSMFEEREDGLYVLFDSYMRDEHGNLVDGFLLNEESKVVTLSDEEPPLSWEV